MWCSNWVSHIKPVGDGSAALKYLAPYIMRVVLSEKNILSLKDGLVTFRYKDANEEKDKATEKVMRCPDCSG